MNESTARPARADSVRNRQLLIEAAREVFAARGFDATLDDIAKHAGLGTGTAYRHFPNKQSLAAEVLSDATTQIVTDARDALDVADPWVGLVQFFQRVAERQAADRGLYETLTGQGDAEEQARIWPQVISAVTELFTRAQQAGAVRKDAAPQDIAAMFAMLGPVFQISRTVRPDLWRRYLAYLLDSLRPGAGPKLPVPPPKSNDLNLILFAGKK